ncbi:hypothetical protein RhiJN_23826 [Ceratobasidium sp. AG-Ba]|nr:hypothetical protein RhiJN_23826 [Ceratobasidium sp. AG-Ba]
MLHQHTSSLIDLFAQQPLVFTSPSSSIHTTMSASPSHFIHHEPHQYPRLPGKPLTGMPYIRKHFYAPEVLPLVGVLSFAIGMGFYFGSGAARKNDVQWQPRTQPWLHTATDSTHWEGAGGVREMLMAAGKREHVAYEEEIKHSIH